MKCHAFSLTELLVSMAIASTLCVLAIQGWSGVQRSSENTKCLSNLRQIGVSIQLYAQDNERATPRLDHQIVSDLYPYLYPDVTNIPVISGTGFPATLQNTVFACPSMRRDEGATSARSYGYNAVLIQHSENPSEFKTGTKSPRIKLSILQQPSKVMFYGDTWSQSAIYSSRLENICKRHDGSFNMLMGDGHVESIPFRDERLQNYSSMLWQGK